MYFSNLLDERGVGTFERKRSFPFVNQYNERSVEAGVVVGENTLQVVEGGEDLFLKGMTAEDMSAKFLEGAKSGLTYRDVADTETNPMITVLARSVKLYVGVKTFLKYINIADDMVLACLVYGACEFTFDDGVSVALQRCNETNLDGKKTVEFTGKMLRESGGVFDKESNWTNRDDVVNAVLFQVVGEHSWNSKNIREMSVVFNDANLKIEREKEARRKQKAEEERLKHEEWKKQQAKLAEEAAKRAAEKEEQEKAEKAAAAAKRAAKKKESAGQKEVSQKVGAQMFLDIVAGL